MPERVLTAAWVILIAGLYLWAIKSIPASVSTKGPPAQTYAGVVREVQANGFTLDLASGGLEGQRVAVELPFETGIYPLNIGVGDSVVVQPMAAPGQPGNEHWIFRDTVRLPALYALAAIFCIAVVLIGGSRGIASLLGLLFSFLVLARFLIPLLAAGVNPILVSVLGGCAILVVTQYLAHGLNAKTTVAIAGTAASLAVSGLLAGYFVTAAHLSGATEESAQVQAMVPESASDLSALLLAGMIVGVVGLLADVTVGQSSVVFALRDANPALRGRDLYRRAMSVGHDHNASLVYTLVLVYAGAALPLMLLFSAEGFTLGAVLNHEDVATEVVRMLIGSLGLVAAVPITTALAAFVAEHREPAPAGTEDAMHGHVH